MDKDVESIRDGILEELAYHFEHIDRLGDGSKEQQAMVQDAKALIDAFNSLCQTENDALDKSERRKLDKMKNDAMHELELEKSKLGWQRVTFELVKILLPAVISVGSYSYFQKRILKFEETGRITSTGGRELHLPKLPTLKL